MDLKTVTILAIAVVAVAVIGSHETEARPSYGQDWSIFVERRTAPACESASEGIRELCQRCAKVTKSRLAYTMCCDSEEDTREWCGKFLSFGITNQMSNSL